LFSVFFLCLPPAFFAFAVVPGLALIKAASDEHGWGVKLAECARIWKGGCIIRAKLLDHIEAAFKGEPDLANLLVNDSCAALVNARQAAFRRVVVLAVASGIPCPALSASLNYLDSYRRRELPANLTQAQRDFFGGHTYRRVDMEGDFHTEWTDAHHSLGDLSGRTAGNV